MKIILFMFALIMLAISEIAMTGVLYDYFGLTYLTIIYFITTSLGSLALLTQLDLHKKLIKLIKKWGKNDQLVDDTPRQDKDEEQDEEMGVLAWQLFFYTLAWGFILIPGLITDAVGFVFLGICFARKNHVVRHLQL